jgi:hypothetical protein
MEDNLVPASEEEIALKTQYFKAKLLETIPAHASDWLDYTAVWREADEWFKGRFKEFCKKIGVKYARGRMFVGIANDTRIPRIAGKLLTNKPDTLYAIHLLKDHQFEKFEQERLGGDEPVMIERKTVDAYRPDRPSRTTKSTTIVRLKLKPGAKLRKQVAEDARPLIAQLLAMFKDEPVITERCPDLSVITEEGVVPDFMEKKRARRGSVAELEEEVMRLYGKPNMSRRAIANALGISLASVNRCIHGRDDPFTSCVRRLVRGHMAKRAKKYGSVKRYLEAMGASEEMTITGGSTLEQLEWIANQMDGPECWKLIHEEAEKLTEHHWEKQEAAYARHQERQPVVEDTAEEERIAEAKASLATLHRAQRRFEGIKTETEGSEGNEEAKGDLLTDLAELGLVDPDESSGESLDPNERGTEA